MTVAVVGSGMGGAAAALAAREAGADVVVFRHGSGATSLAGALFDVAPMQTAQTPAAAVHQLIRAHPHHAYAQLSREPVDAVVAECTAILKKLGVFRFNGFDEPGLTTVFQPGGTRVTTALQEGVVSIDQGEVIGIVGWSGQSSAWAFTMARLLADRFPDNAFLPIEVEYFARRTDHTLSARERAALIEKTPAADRLAEALKRALGAAHVDTLVLPHSAGFETPQAGVLSERVGLPVREFPDALGGVFGRRLAGAIDNALREVACELRTVRVTAVEPGHDGVVVRTEDESATFDAVVFAGGSVLGGGMRASGDCVTDVPLLAVPVRQPSRTPPGALAPHVLGGVEWDPQCRVCSGTGEVWSERVFAAGSVLYGVDPTDGSGYGTCVVTGATAGRCAGAGSS